MPVERPRRLDRRKLALLAFVAFVALLTAAWALAPSMGSVDPHRLARLALALRDGPLAPLAVVGIYVAAGFVAMPASLLVVATLALFGVWPGMFWCEVGMLASGSVLWSIGRFAARDGVARWLAARADPRLARLDAQLVRRGMLAVALLRMSPLPYALLSMAFGASGVRYRDFAIGTVVGVLPFLALMGGLAHGVDAWLAAPGVGGAALLATALGLFVLASWWIGRRIIRRG